MLSFKSFLETRQSRYYFDLLPKNALQHFEKRTREHIKRVNFIAGCLYNVNKDQVSPSFLDNVKNHDRTKFYSELYPGYVWINAYYNLKINYPSEVIKQMAELACSTHYKMEDHHPEHFENVNMMTNSNMLEMIADWCAMSMELNDSLTKWWNKQQKKYNFDEQHMMYINSNIETLLSCMSEQEYEYAFLNGGFI